MVTEKQQSTEKKERKPRYLFISVGTSLAPTLAEVKSKIPQAFSDDADFIALDANRDIETFQSQGLKTYVLGPQSRKGKGCGGKRELGKAAFEESKEDLFQTTLVTEDIAGVFIIVAPGRGGTGTGAIVDLCLAFKEKVIPIILFVFKPSEFAHEAGSLQFRDFDDVCAQLYQQRIKFYLLNQDWVYKTASKDNSIPLRQARSLMHQKVVESIAMVSIFWAGNPLIDAGDLEEQVLSGAGNTKVVRAEVDLSASDHIEAVTRAVIQCIADDLFELRGPAHYIVSYQTGDWFPDHNAALCELVDGYCTKSLEEWNSAQTTDQSQRLESLLFIHKQVPLDPEPDAKQQEPVREAPAELAFPFKPTTPAVMQTVSETPQLRGSLTLLISTIIPEAPAEVGRQLEPGSPGEAPLNGHAASVSQAQLGSRPQAQLPAPAPAPRAAAPSAVKLSPAELQEAKSLHTEVYQGSIVPEELTLTQAIRRVNLMDLAAKKAVSEMEPDKFFRLLNQIRRDAKLESYVFGWDELSGNISDFARKGAVEALWASHEAYAEQLATPEAGELSSKVWILRLLEVAKSKNLEFPTFSVTTAGQGKVRFNINMGAADFGALAACAKQRNAEERQQRETLLLLTELKSLFVHYFKDVFVNHAQLSATGAANDTRWFGWPRKTVVPETAPSQRPV